MVEKHIGMNLDYKYEDPKHPESFFFRSDQYPYIQYGIPSVWYFCGTTEDYHQETDTVDRVDFAKMEKVARFVYLTALAVKTAQVAWRHYQQEKAAATEQAPAKTP